MIDDDKEITLIQDGGKVWTTSLEVAQRFEKDHRNVLRSFERIECTEEFAALNFERGSYPDANGQMRPMVRMTKDGFMLLVMGMTGTKAARVRELFIKAFNMMERLALEVAREVDDHQTKMERCLLAFQEQTTAVVVALGGSVVGIKHDVVELNRKVDSKFVQIDEQIEKLSSRKSKRKEISEDTKRKHRRILDALDGRCPGCRKPIDPTQFDHFFDSQRSNFEHSWPLCKSCHNELTTDNETRTTFERRFHAYQEFASAVFKADEEELRKLTPEQFTLL